MPAAPSRQAFCFYEVLLMHNLFLDFFLVVLGAVFTSELFIFPVILCLLCYLVYLVLSLIRGRY